MKQFVAALFTVLLMAGLTALFFETQSVAANTVRVACVGDSITRDTDYPEILAAMLGANYTVRDFGVGRTTVSLQFEKPYMKQQAFKDAQSFNPDVVVILLGTNDAYLSQEQRSNLMNDYKTLIASFQALSSTPEIYIVVPPPVFNNTMGLPAEVIDNEVRPLVSQIAADLELPTIDVHTPLLDNPEYFPDGVHPNTEGSQVIASEIYEYLVHFSC
ncbi:MAG: GDSL-type esterase/lipase family protein [Candidatus Bathyarchaeota archaeon]|nr:GDSL-type esterase/lipase family protein [Candidatus Bathyarchaeota archaeon]